MVEIKKKLTVLMHCDDDLLTKFKEIFNMEPNASLTESMLKIGNPL